MDEKRRPGPVEALLGPRIAEIIVATRRKLGWAQRELAERAGISRAKVARIELGHGNHGRIDEAARLLDALGVRVDLQVRPPVLVGAPSQRDAAHARVVAYTSRHLQQAGVVVAREVPIGADRVRGWIDIVGTADELDATLIVECKTDLDDVGALERQVAWYEREAPWVARRLGWPTRRRQIVIVTMLATHHNVELVRSNRPLLQERFPLSVPGLRLVLAGERPPAGPLRTVAFVDPGRRGPGWLIQTPLGPGRPVAPYDDARAFLEGRRHDPGRR
jgi:transcriptional regulator with XRE-family HTH domain